MKNIQVQIKRFAAGIILMACSALLTFPSCSSEIEMTNEELIFNSPYLIGNWEGTGSFADVKYKKSIGEIPILVQISEDAEIFVRIGEVEIINPRIKNAKFGFVIRGDLSGSTVKGVDLEKKYGSILLVLPEEQRTDSNESEANFHLSKSGGFDFGLIVGGVKLVKKENNE